MTYDEADLIRELAEHNTKSVQGMHIEDRRAGVETMLSDLSLLARQDGCIAAAWSLEMVTHLNSQLAECRDLLRQFGGLVLNAAADCMPQEAIERLQSQVPDVTGIIPR